MNKKYTFSGYLVSITLLYNKGRILLYMEIPGITKIFSSITSGTSCVHSADTSCQGKKFLSEMIFTCSFQDRLEKRFDEAILGLTKRVTKMEEDITEEITRSKDAEQVSVTMA